MDLLVRYFIYMFYISGAKHNALLKTRRKSSGTLNEFFISDGKRSTQPCSSTNDVGVFPSTSTDLNSFVTRNEVIDAEIKWVLKCIPNHYSSNLCKETVSTIVSR